jgi:Ca2+/Na+ antiporter
MHCPSASDQVKEVVSMRWLKVLAVAVAVVVVFVVISAVVHILYLVGVGLLIAAVLFAAVKGWEQAKRARQRREERRQQREERRVRPSIEASRQQPTWLPPTVTSSGFDVDEELARLKRELP